MFWELPEPTLIGLWNWLLKIVKLSFYRNIVRPNVVSDKGLIMFPKTIFNKKNRIIKSVITYSRFFKQVSYDKRTNAKIIISCVQQYNRFELNRIRL